MIYTAYLCKCCRKEFILLTGELEATKRAGNYISCPHCGSKGIKESKISDSLKECMEARAYYKVNGAWRQK